MAMWDQSTHTMLVEELMSTDIVTCEATVSLRQAVERMLRHRVGSVIVTDDGDPAGIVTERDCIHAGYVTDSPYSEIPVRTAMTEELVTVAPSKPIRKAMELMKQHGVKKMVVVRELDIVGVLTASDLLRHYSEIRSEIHDIEQPRKNQASESARFELE